MRKFGFIYSVEFSVPLSKPLTRYQNFRVISDGKERKLEPCDPVVPALAEERSVLMNALTGKRSPLRGRMNVDAVDLNEKLEKLS